MTQKIEDAIAAVVVMLQTVTALKQVPVNPPETVNVDTYAIVYTRTGVIDNGVVGGKFAMHSIAIDALTKRTDLGRDMARVKPFVDQIPNTLLADATLGGTVQTFRSVSYELVYPDYAGVAMVGYQFILNDVKIIT